MERMKRWLSLALALVLVLSYVPANVFAAEAGEESTPQETTASAETTVETTVSAEPEETVVTQSAQISVELPSNEELYTFYAEGVLYGMGGVSMFATGDRSAGAKLTGDEKLVYDALVPFIKDIAAGNRASTVVRLGYSTSYDTDKYVYFTGTSADFDLGAVMDALLMDYPYEMYWLNTLSSARMNSITTYPEDILKWMEISMPVAVTFASGDYTADTAKTGAVTSAATKAAAIVAKYASASDYDKLVGYRNEICALVSYDDTAASGGDSYYKNTDSNPWQLIYVFDGNTATNVVCEGYSKAFQYLCDLGGVPCICVRGTMTEPNGVGGHMWNVVTLEGKNYLVDVANSDEDTLGQNGELFLAGASGSPTTGYSFTAGGKTVSYAYGYDTPQIWTTEELTLASKSYNSTDVTVCFVPNTNWKEANAWFAAYYWDGNGSDGFVKLEADGFCYTGEIPEGYNNIIFIRKNPSDTTLSWNNVWAQTGDLTLDASKSCFVQNAGWVNTGTWTTCPPAYDYYLAGYLNNANVGIEGAANASANKFANGKVTVTFTADSYVCLGVQYGTSVIGNYMAQSYVSSGSTAAMYTTGGEKLLVPAGKYTFTLAENADGSVTLSYAHAHTMTYHAEVGATCATSGNVAYYACSGCGKNFSDEAGTTVLSDEDLIIPSGAHNYDDNGFCATETDGSVCGAYEPASGSGTEADPYLIENAGQLFWFAAVVNDGYGDVAKNNSAWGKLTASIEIPDGHNWVPIGREVYYGSFDGGNFTVSNMQTSGDYPYVGMFGKVEGSELKNITVGASGFVTTNDVYGYAGGLVGYAYGQDKNVTITNCWVTFTTVIGDEAGGIVGRMDSFPEITNCSGSSNIITSSSDYGTAGGIAGTMRMGGSIASCNSGSNTIAGYYCGGIAGYVENQAGPYANRSNTVTGCSANSTVGNADSEYTGGIVGYVSSVSELTINNCRTGNCTLTAAANTPNSRVGGLLGSCANHDSVSVKVSNSYTYNVTINGFNLAYLTCGQYVTVENCYSNVAEGANTPLTIGTSYISKVERKTDEQFASGEVCWLLNGEKADGAWGQSLGTASGIFPNQGDRKVYKVALDCQGSVGYSNTESTGTPAHSYDEKGFCTNKADYVVCDAYQPAVKVTEDNYTELGLTDAYIGYYAITNAGNLYWFADKVDNENVAYGYANAVLTADIMIPSKPTGTRYWNPIGSADAKYSGIFDGNGKAIGDIFAGDTTADMVGLVAWLTEDGVVKNVTVTGVRLNGNDTVGAIVAYNEGTVELCGNTASVIGEGISIGGIVGVNVGTVRNCWNTGRISGEDAGGIVGDNEPGATVENCWYTGELEGTNAGGIVGFHRTGATAENCYTTQETAIATAEGTVSKVETKTADQFASGEVAYLLGGVWGQNIDNDQPAQTVPALNGATVYLVTADCQGNLGYSNTESTGTPAHNYVNGFCVNEANGVVCDAYEPAALVTEENYTELGLSADYIGYYAITNAGNLYWFADKVDNENAAYKTAKVVLTADITVNTGTMDANTTGAREWNPIGYCISSSDYAAFNGTFDGNNKKISGLYFSDTDSTAGKSVALIAETESGALVKNVTVTNTWFHGYAQVAGIVGDNGGTITGCVSEASLSCTWSYIGGMAGWNEGTITGCINRGTIAGKYNNSGGIAGHNAGTVELCGNEGNISDDWCFAGGIAGNNAGTIRNCWNTGEVYVTNSIAGGIAGKNNPDDLLENCWSTGAVSCGSDPEAAGGIVGVSENATQRNCYSVMKPVGVIEDKGGVSTVENMDQITRDQLASGEVAYLLRTRAAAGTDVWGQNIDNGHPVQTVPALNGTDVYYGYIDCHSTEAKYTNTAVSAEPVDHSYDNGFCTNELTDGTVCDAYEPAVLVTAENREELGLAESYIGYYAINNGGNLYWFADKVDNENATYGSVNVVLTADVTVNEGTVTASSTGMRDWNPIGWFSSTSDDRAAFSGTFDGNGKSISGLYFNNKDIYGVSLFAITGETALVKNVTVTNSYFCGNYNNSAVVAINLGTVSSCFNEATLKGEGQIGGIVGRNLGLVELCGNTGAITGGMTSTGGIVGDNQNTVRNCWNTGNIQADYNYVGGITGANNSSGTNRTAALTENCWSTGTVVSYGRTTAGGIVGAGWWNLGGVRNCYSLMKPVGGTWNGHPVTDVEQKTLDQFASGEVAYLLRTRAAEGTDVWGQNIDNDQTRQNVPALNGADVYLVVVDCAGGLGYSNTDAPKIAHNYVNGFCTNENAEGGLCDAYEPAVPVTADNYTELGLTADYVGYYAISNAGQLYWFADKVDNEHDTYGSAKAVLTDNITVNAGTVTAESAGMRAWNPIGYFNSNDDNATFSGTFDGNGKTVSGLYYNDTSGRYVGLVSILAENGTVKNVTVTNSYFMGDRYTAAIAGLSHGTIIGCVNHATVSGTSYSGGITAYNSNLVELCGNTGAISARSGFAGGIVSYNASSEDRGATIRNCWNTGSIYTADDYAGGIAGDNSGLSSTYPYGLVENCWSTGSVSAKEEVGGVTGGNWQAGVVNCYSVMAPVGTLEQDAYTRKTEQKTDAQFASGEVAYLLRTRATGGTNVWGQDLDNGKEVQTVPTFTGADVYQVPVDCQSNVGYSNTNRTEAPDHSYDDNGFCTNEGVDGTVCDAYEPAVLVTEDNYTELGLTADYVGYYAISNAGQLYWFADKVDNEHDTYGSVNVVLTDNITVNAGTVTAESAGMRAWTPAGDWDHQYGGIFDGNGKTVSGLYYNDNGNDNSRYVALISCMAESGVVKNVTVTNSAFVGYAFTAAIVGYNYGTVTGCVNNAPISGSTYSGGIAANNRGTVELCGNTGTIHAWAVSGGIVARSMSNGPAQAAVVKNCWNTGSISSEDSTAGGIAGENSALVSTYAFAEVRDCWSTGSVSAPEAAGGVTGDNWRARVSNCYSVMAPVGVLEQGAYTDKAEQKTDAQFASGEVAYLLGGVWGQDLDNGKEVQTVPTFTGADVYYGYSSCAETEAKYTNDASISAVPIEHDWEYTADGASITGECKNECGTDGGEVTLVLDGSAVYDGSEKTVKADGTLSGIDTLPAVTYEGDRVNVGTFTAYLTLEDGTKAQLEVTVTAKEITPTVEGVEESYTYTGSAIEPTVTVKDGDKVLTEGTDYDVTYGENLNVGEGTVKVTLKGNYEGEAEQTFDITAKAITPTVEGVEEGYGYTGSAIQPTVTVKDGDKVLTEGKDYDVTYGENLNVGEGTVKITLKGNYEGELEQTFDITAKAITPTVEGVEESYDYTGEAIKPAVTVKGDGKTLVEGTDYEVTYGDNTNVADGGSVKVTLKGNYEGELEQTFTITARTLTISGMTGTDKVYDGKTDAAVELKVDGIEATDDVEVSFQAAYESAKAGTQRIHVTGITLSGKDAPNYVIASQTTGSGAIAQATVTVTSVTVADKTYDGTTDAEVTEVLSSGIVSGEDVTVTAAGSFDSAGSGENKTVALTYALSGEGSGNYVLAETTGTTTASIKPVDAEEVMKPLEDVTTDNVTSDDLPAIEETRKELEDALEDPGLTDEQKKEIEDALDELDELEQRVDDAQNAVIDESVNDTMDVTGENVTKDDREDLEEAKDVLEDALDNFGDNYTDEEKEIIQENIDRIEDALDVLDKVEAVEDTIEALPDFVQPDDEETVAAIEEAKKAYDELTDHEKEQVSDEAVEKLEGLLTALTYEIIKGNGLTWAKGTGARPEFTANGPYGKFAGLLVDGKEVAERNYEAKSGSTVITLKTAYIEGLTLGKHTITVLYTNGQADGYFYITVMSDAPATGDSANVALWSGIALISLAAAAALILGKKRLSV